VPKRIDLNQGRAHHETLPRAHSRFIADVVDGASQLVARRCLASKAFSRDGGERTVVGLVAERCAVKKCLVIRPRASRHVELPEVSG
jgi:hypothetical protein